MRLQPLARGRKIKNDFRPRTDNDQIKTRQLRQIGRDIRQIPAMHAADAARRKYFYPCALRNPRGRGNSRCAVPTLCDGDAQITATELVDIRASSYVIQLSGAEADVDRAFEDSDCRRDCAALAHDLFKPSCSLKILRAR